MLYEIIVCILTNCRIHTFRSKITGIAICWFLLLCTISEAATPEYKFTHYTSTNSGLPYNMVNKIIQDEKGFIWFGTSSGLSRFDGTRFRNYTKEELGLQSVYITALCKDGDGNLWVGTDLGVTVYNVHTDRFEPFTQKSDLETTIHNKANAICKGPDGIIWISVNGQGLFAYDPTSKLLRNYFFEHGKQTLPVNIRTLHVDAENGLWLSLFYHSLLYIAPGQPIPRSIEEELIIRPFQHDDVTAIQTLPGKPRSAYIASVIQGLCLLDQTSGAIRTLIPPPQSDFSAEDLFVDARGQVWMPTNLGVYVYNPEDETVRCYSADEQDRFSLSDNHAFAVYMDANDGLWIGTNVGGVNYSSAIQRNFEKQYLVKGQALGDCLVRGFADDQNGHIWIATEKEGLLVYDKEAKHLAQITDACLPKTQFTVCYDSGILWIGTIQGLYRFNPRTRECKAYETLGIPFSMQDRRVFVVFRTSHRELFVGTTVGLFRYDRAQDHFDPIRGFEGVFVTDMDEDEEQTLWISTYAKGLIRYDPLVDRIQEHYINDPSAPTDGRSIPSNKLFSVSVGSNDRIWTTSFNDGFCGYDKTTGEFKCYTTTQHDLLPTDICFMILEDDQGMLWISSDKGLLSLDPATDEIRLFSVYDGLLDNEFKNCGWKDRNGDLYFGSRSGFIRFNPERFTSKSGNSRLVITGLRIGDDLVTPSEAEKGPLACNVDETSEIHLSPRQNSFGFGFAILNSNASGSNAIQCKLEGFDSVWRHTTIDNTVFYYNVPAGTYTLKTKALNGIGNEEIQHSDLTITVAQRFYKSTVAILLYMVVLVSMVAGIFVFYYRRAIAREKRKHEIYKQQKEEELFQQKLSFFSSVVHEIKTPLTVIRTPLQNIMASERLDPSLLDELATIGNGTEYLDRLVRELLDFIRIEKHGYQLNRRMLDLVERIGFLCSNFSETVKARNLKLSFSYDPESIYIDADESALDKILNNLLHNAVKYAETYIRVTVIRKTGVAVVEISNDGPAIAPEQRPEIFKPFVKYGTDEASSEQSFGIGLPLARTLAEMHDGTLELSDDATVTTFVLTLPVPEVQVEPVIGCEKPAAARPLGASILLVEDNRELSAYLTRKLGADFQVLTAHSAEKACALLRKHEPDIIVTDIALPGMSGIEFCRTISADFNCSHIPVIVVSAISAIDTKIACIEAGASTYIEKPFSIEYLQACIKGILDKRAGLKKAYQNPSVQVDPKQFNLQGADEEFLHRLDEVIMQHLKDPAFSSKQIEEALFLSRSTLIRKVRALLDTTPNDYLRFKRLSVAAQLLSRNKCRVSEVCFAVGFNSPSYFAKCFKEQFGILPAEYQKK